MERYTVRQVNRALAQEQLLQRFGRGEEFGELCQELGLSQAWLSALPPPSLPSGRFQLEGVSRPSSRSLVQSDIGASSLAAAAETRPSGAHPGRVGAAFRGGVPGVHFPEPHQQHSEGRRGRPAWWTTLPRSGGAALACGTGRGLFSLRPQHCR